MILGPILIPPNHCNPKNPIFGLSRWGHTLRVELGMYLRKKKFWSMVRFVQQTALTQLILKLEQKWAQIWVPLIKNSISAFLTFGLWPSGAKIAFFKSAHIKKQNFNREDPGFNSNVCKI